MAEVEVAPQVADIAKPEAAAAETEETKQSAEEVAKDVEEGAKDVSGDSEMKDAAPGDDDGTKKEKACKQIEFYFADSNLPYDKFMWTLHTANEEHWVPIATVASFKRMKPFSSHGLPWIVEALKTSEELEVDETNNKVRRRTEVQEPKGQLERSVYAKGFGANEYPELQQELEDFFKAYGRVNAVRMRRENETKTFKGSVFTEFADFSSVEKFLKADPKPTWKGEELLIMTKEGYCEMKIKEKGLTGKAAQIRRQNQNPTGRKGFNAFVEMKEKEKRAKRGKDEPETAPEVWLDFMGTRLRVHEEDDGSVKEEDIPHVKGSTLKFTGAGEGLQWTDIKTPLAKRFTRPPMVKNNKGDTWGLAGFDRALTEEDITFVKENVKLLDGKEVTWTLAEDEEERTFIIERAQIAARKVFSISRRSNGASRGGRGGRGGRGRGGRGAGRGGRGGGRGGFDRKEKVGGADKPAAAESSEATAGEKRKRAIEPDGGIGVGERGQAVPVIQSAKKAKTDEAS